MKTNILIMLPRNLRMNKSLLIKLIFFILLSIVLSPVLIQTVKSCHLGCGTFYLYCSPTCGGTSVPSITACDWSIDLGGCEMGIYAGQLYSSPCGNCKAEAKWFKPPGDNGAICKVRWGMACEGSFEGKYDASEGKCVECNGKIQVKAVKCGVPDDTTAKCESACGAEDFCDEVGSTPKIDNDKICAYKAGLKDKNGNTVVIDYCLYEVCDSSKVCYRYETLTTTYYCIYDNGFKWSTSIPSEICNDGVDNDCDGLIDCADPDCAGKTGPNGVICCKDDSDCPDKMEF